jgi:hypothetical protein
VKDPRTHPRQGISPCGPVENGLSECASERRALLVVQARQFNFILPSKNHETVDIGKLPRFKAQRSAIVGRLAVAPAIDRDFYLADGNKRDTWPGSSAADNI